MGSPGSVVRPRLGSNNNNSSNAATAAAKKNAVPSTKVSPTNAKTAKSTIKPTEVKNQFAAFGNSVPMDVSVVFVRQEDL